MDPTTVYVLSVVFVATTIRSTFGFGEGLVALPLLAFVIPVEIAAPVVVLLSTTIAAVVVVQDWRNIHLRSTAWLLAPTLLGIPLGIALLTGGHQRVVKGVLATVILFFSIYLLASKRAPELRSDKRSWLLGCGFLAGVLGGAYGLNGPPLVIYGSMRRWSPQHFRATLQGYFLPASAVGMAGYWYAGLWVPAVTHDYLLSLAAAVPAIFVGRAVNRRLNGDTFLRVVYGALAGIGLILLVQAIRTRS
jgi:uncharacterized membrane protein YfcA